MHEAERHKGPRLYAARVSAPTPTSVAAAGHFPLQPDELATGLLLGNVGGQGPRTRGPGASSSPRVVLELIAEAALRRGPVWVSFSGGRDSSAVLAVTAHTARRLALPPPTAVTLDIVGSGGADEAEWQELVLEAVRVEQVRLPVHDELGLLGPVARALMQQHGLVYPPNAYMHQPMLVRAGGGTLLTGAGGDELFQSGRAGAAALVLAGLRRPDLRDLAVITAGLVTPALLRRRAARNGQLPLPWIRAECREAVKRRWWSNEHAEHRGYAVGVLSLIDARSVAALLASSGLLSKVTGTALAHPLLTPAFVRAAAAQGGRAGYKSRDEAMRQLVGDLLPDDVLTRQSKATMDDAVWTAETREAATDARLLQVVATDAALVPLVDIAELEVTWAQPHPHYQSAALLQAAWLATAST